MPTGVNVSFDTGKKAFSEPENRLAAFLVKHPSYALKFNVISEKLSKDASARKFENLPGVLSREHSKTIKFGSADDEFYSCVRDWMSENLAKAGADYNVEVGNILEDFAIQAVEPRYTHASCRFGHDKEVTVEVGENRKDSRGKKIDVTAWDQTNGRGEFYECKGGESSLEEAQIKMDVLADFKDVLGESVCVGLVSFVAEERVRKVIKRLSPLCMDKGLRPVGHDTLAAGFLDNPCAV